MNLPVLSVKRPVLTIMLNAILIILGLVAYFRIGLQEIPNITLPIIQVTTELPGGSPSLVNETITKPLENVLNTLDGLKDINSTSTSGLSTVTIRFQLGQNLDAAYSEVESKINQVLSTFPQGVHAPQINKASTNATPIMLIALYGNRTLQELDTIARDTIKPQLENIPGLGDIFIEGAEKPHLTISLNLAKMAKLKLTPVDIQNAFTSHHLNLPAGFIITSKKQFTLNLDLEMHTTEELQDLVIAYRDKAPIFLKDIATIRLEINKSKQRAYFNGKPAIGISFVKKSNGNTIEIVNAIQKKLNTLIEPELPEGVNIGTIFESAHNIINIINSLTNDLWLSLLAAAAVILIFLRSIRSTYIIITAIPVSLLGAIAAIYFFGYTFNVITLLALILLIGIVVDDAIVMLENIHRYGKQHNVSPKEAALNGSTQVIFAVLAASLSLIAIFGPVIFMGSILGLFFRSFAVVVTVGVFISLFVSLTLTPMLCSKFLSFSASSSIISKILATGFNTLDSAYKRFLRFSLQHYRWVIFFAILLMLLSIPLLILVNKSFLPAQKDSGTFTISVQAPQGYNIQYMQKATQQITAILDKYPDIVHHFTSIQPATQATITVKLKPYYELSISQPQLMDILQLELKQIPGINTFVSEKSGGGGGNGSPMQFDVLGNDFIGLQQATDLLRKELIQRPEIQTVFVNFVPNAPEYQVKLDRQLAAQLGVTPEAVAYTLLVLGDGYKISKFNQLGGATRYDVILQASPGQFNYPEDIANIYLPNQEGELIRLNTIAKLIPALGHVNITRKNRMYSISVSVIPTVPLGEAISLIQKTAKKILPEGYHVEMGGNAATFENMAVSFLFALVDSVLLLYMVLASQFNSFLQPVIILVAQPLALIGGLLTLWIVGASLNIYSIIGVLLLMGLVAKNSILLIDLTNQKREQGLSVYEALTEACPTRMRPVIMTSLTIIFAMLPAALSTGPGSAMHRALSLVIIGGMISSTLLTLIIVPAVYTLLVREKKQDKNLEL